MSSTTLLATDHQHSVLKTLKANQLPQTIPYSPYGHRPATCWLLSLLGFNGELAEPMTGHYLLGNGHRAFNPVLMRFNSPDSWSPFGAGWFNAYAYCRSDPVNLNDPTGHVFNNIKRTLSHERLISQTGTNGTMRIGEAPSTSTLPTARVAPVQAALPTPRSSIAPTFTPDRHSVSGLFSNELSRFTHAPPQLSGVHMPMSPAMRVAVRNAVGSPRIAVVLPTPITDPARLGELPHYANLEGMGFTRFPREAQLAAQSTRMFEIRRANDQRLEGWVLRGNRA